LSLSGRVMLLRAEQCWNALLLIVSRSLLQTTRLRAEQRVKTFDSRTVSLLGRVILVRIEHAWNAPTS